MKPVRFFLVMLSMALCGAIVRAAETEFKPVDNPIAFSGEFVTFRDAKPKFKPLHQAQPVYPEALLSRRVEGYAVIAFLVDLDGTTTQCQVVKASDVAFGEAARTAIAQWRFSPPKFDGKRGRIAMQFPVEFSLQAQNAPEAAAE